MLYRQLSKLVSLSLGIVILFTTYSGAQANPAGKPLDESRKESVDFLGPLYPHPDNPRYFTDNNQRAILLTGSHTWSNLQDNGPADPPAAFDYSAYLDFLQANNHNFFRLWTWEQAKWTAETTDDYWFDQVLFERPGPGTALDGKARFDLTLVDQSFLNRMRQRIIEAGQQGMYVSILLFQGWSVENKIGIHNPWPGHPFNAANNINGINGDPNGDGEGLEIHTLQNPAITALQENYVQLIIDSVNDLDNVLYEICNNCNPDSVDWQYHMIDFIHAYEAGLPKQHPVGMTRIWPGNGDSVLYASPADWITPGGLSFGTNPPPATGDKVIISDTDHIWGIGGDRAWVWKSFLRGQNPIFMDAYDGAAYGLGAPENWDTNDPTWVSLRLNMGAIREYANRMDLVNLTPQGQLASTGYLLANLVPRRAEYLTYLPTGGSVTLDLSGSSGQLHVEWFNPENGAIIEGANITGGSNRTISAPFPGDAVAYLYQERSPTAISLASLTARASSQPLTSPAFLIGLLLAACTTFVLLRRASRRTSTLTAHGSDPTPTRGLRKRRDRHPQ